MKIISNLKIICCLFNYLQSTEIFYKNKWRQRKKTRLTTLPNGPPWRAFHYANCTVPARAQLRPLQSLTTIRWLTIVCYNRPHRQPLKAPSVTRDTDTSKPTVRRRQQPDKRPRLRTESNAPWQAETERDAVRWLAECVVLKNDASTSHETDDDCFLSVWHVTGATWRHGRRMEEPTCLSGFGQSRQRRA